MAFFLIFFFIFLIAIIALCYFITNPPGTEELKKFQGPSTQWVFGNALQIPKEIGGMQMKNANERFSFNLSENLFLYY